MTSRAYYCASVGDFLDQEEHHILGVIVAAVRLRSRPFSETRGRNRSEF